MAMDLDLDWSNFITNTSKIDEVKERKEIRMPECDPIKISTKTKIVYLNVDIDLKKMFWVLPMIDYQDCKEGIIKKQIKFNFNTKEEVEEFDYNLSLERAIHTFLFLLFFLCSFFPWGKIFFAKKYNFQKRKRILLQETKYVDKIL